MKTRLWITLALLALTVLTACGSTPASSDSAALDVVHLQTTEALAHWLPQAADCAGTIPNLGIASEIVAPDALSLGSADLVLRLGARQPEDPFTAVMGRESLVLVVGDQVPLSSLSSESLQSLYAGDWASWSDVPEAGDVGNLPIVLLSYPTGHELETLFSQTYLEGLPILGGPQEYASPNGLAELLNANPTAIGYTLGSLVPIGYRTVPVTGTATEPIFYVLAVTPEEPTGGLRQLLLCLQNAE